MLDVPPGSAVRILDVGAGPLTCVGKRWSGRQCQIIAVNPMARQYDRLLARHHIEAPVRTAPAHAEDLARQFPANHFDLVHARNCLDHSFVPVRAIRQMIAIVKPGCFVFLEHAINEGEYERYHGLHQWNFFADGSHFCVSGARTQVDVTETLAPIAEVSCEITKGCLEPNENDWIAARLRKKR